MNSRVVRPILLACATALLSGCNVSGNSRVTTHLAVPLVESTRSYRMEATKSLVVREAHDWNSLLSLRLPMGDGDCRVFLAEDESDVYRLTLTVDASSAPELTSERLVGVSEPAFPIPNSEPSVAVYWQPSHKGDVAPLIPVRILDCGLFFLPRQLWSGSSLCAVLGEHGFLGHDDVPVMEFFAQVDRDDLRSIGEVDMEEWRNVDCLQVGSWMYYGAVRRDHRFISGRVGTEGMSSTEPVACSPFSPVRVVPSGSSACFLFEDEELRLQILKDGELFPVAIEPLQYFDATTLGESIYIVARTNEGALRLLKGDLETGFEVFTIASIEGRSFGEFRLTSARGRLFLLWADLAKVNVVELVQQ